MQVIDIDLAKKVVSFVRENPGVTPEQLVRNIPELATCESLDFALDCCPQDNGFLITIDENNHVQLGDAAHFVDERIEVARNQFANSDRQVPDAEKVKQKQKEQRG